MSDELRFMVPGSPVPKQMGVRIKGKIIKPPRVRAYEETVRLMALLAVNRERWGSQPVQALKERFCVTLRAFVEDARAIDCDNIAKSVLDGIKTICFPDDRQVDELHVHKSIDRESPRVEIHVRRL